MKKVILTAAFSLVGVIAVSAQQSTPLEKPQETTSNQSAVQYDEGQPRVQNVKGQDPIQPVEGQSEATEPQTAKKAELNSKMQKHWNDMKKKLNLSPDQEEKIKVLYENQALEAKKIMDPNNKVDKEKMKQEMKAWQEQTEVEMQKILSPEQYKLKSMMDKKSAKLEKKKSALLK
jgi:hypothetical protein